MAPPASTPAPPADEPAAGDTVEVGRADYAGARAVAYSKDVNYTKGPDQAITERYLATIPRFLTGKYVIDVACGGGELTSQQLAPRGPERLVGVDISPDFIRQAVREAPPYPSVTYVVGDMNRLPLAPGKADLVVSRFGVHYAEDLKTVFGSISQVLKSGGEVVFLTNMMRSDDGDTLPVEVARDRWIPIQLSDRVRVNNLAHSRQDYLDALRESGLEVDSMETFNADYKIADDYKHRDRVHVDATIVRAHKVDGAEVQG